MQAGDCKDQLLPPPPKFHQIKQSSNGEASFRVLYYGAGSGTVPFTWETSPGTPKHPLFEENSLPPLTPPPSYLSTPKINNKNSKSKIFDFNFFSKSKSTSEKALFSSASVSSTSGPSRNLYARSGNRWSGSIVHYSPNEDESEKTPAKSPVPALCFGGSGNRSGASGGNSGVFRRVKNVKKKILLIVGGSGTV